MKKIFMIVMAIAIALLSTNVEAKKKKDNKKNNPFGEVYQLPTSETDTEEYFGATGVAYGPINQLGELQINALQNAQDIVRMKMKHSYKGMISNYSRTNTNKLGSDIQSKLERGGEHIIDAIVNDTQSSAPPTINPDDKGNVTVFMSVRVYKQELADKISQYVSEDEELKMQFEEDQFRKRMDETFKKYKEEKQ